MAKADAEWVAGLARYLRRCGAEPDGADRCTGFVDAAIAGLHLDQHLDPGQDVAQVVDDVAAAALMLSSGGLD